MTGKEKCNITIYYDTNNSKEIYCNKNSRLLDVFNENNIYIDATCGGKGTCGKCKVKILDGNLSPLTQNELNLLSEKEKNEGYRLSCETKILGNIKVQLKNAKNKAQIVSEGINHNIKISPNIKKKVVKLSEPTISDQRNDCQRLKECLGTNLFMPLRLLRKLPSLLRENNYTITVVHNESKILNIEPGDTLNKSYGAAVDIGTTTVVVYLVDLNTGKIIDVISELNSQKSFGGDVISRITYAVETNNGLKQLQEKIVSQLNRMIVTLINRNNISNNNIYNIVIVGNTTMTHLLLGINPKNIATSPFIPVVTEKIVYSANDLNFDINDSCIVTILPCISGYVGADIVSAILSSTMTKHNKLSLLIDIGTNGEIALGNSKQIVCCSTAAGPAFEGAHIRNGVGGIAGAINSIAIKNSKIEYTTILNMKPIGICGSAIIDIVSLLINAGIIDETGRILEEDEIESELGKKLVKNIVKIDNMAVFLIAEGKETENGEPIVITQKDIREIQLAKAAIAAGINTLIAKMHKNINDISCVYLAGGFGSYIDKKSAVKIGLLPKEIENKIKVIGNAAGTGAIISLLSNEQFNDCDKIKNNTEYIELSTTPEFQDEYINCMYF